MLQGMSEARTLVLEARRDAELSVRELARLAGVSFTTISRIESGDVDPTVGMLRRIVEATGRTLRITAEPAAQPRRSLADLAFATTASQSAERPDWTRLRAFLDYLALHPEEVPRAITARPHARSPLMNALLAGIAEKLADDHGLPRPGWTRTVAKMRPEWSAPGTPATQAAQRRNAPRQLLERGLMIDEQSLWRNRRTVGV